MAKTVKKKVDKEIQIQKVFVGRQMGNLFAFILVIRL